ncbi:MAG: uroporphyrinogen-III synthase [Rhodospirillales bacterium]|nr:uroporphyrinogen-III synthase [Rhodospirillales bacterium]
MRLLVTRPRDDAEALAGPLAALGIEILIEPLLGIRYRDGPPPDLAGVQAILATSANGVRALVRRCDDRDVAVFAVGDATARAARAAGYRAVESARGTVEDLARLVCARLDAGAGALLHVAGKTVAGDLGGLVAGAGFKVCRHVYYEAAPAECFSAAAVRAMAEGEVDGVIFFSPRTAAIFVSLAEAHELTDVCPGMVAYCLSPAVAERARLLPWRRAVTAARPDQETLIATIGQDRAVPKDGP